MNDEGLKNIVLEYDSEDWIFIRNIANFKGYTSCPPIKPSIT
ncbi:hypothetical protein [Clostridium ljungdahlii]|nr:hypothetical protein [Clostridium ljungdahlii]